MTGIELLVPLEALTDATNTVVLETIDLDRPRGPNQYQTGLSVLIAAAAIVLSALLVRFYSSRILDDEESEHARSVESGIRSRDRETLRIPATDKDDVESYRPDIRALLDGDFENDVPTLLEAAREVRGAWLERRRAASRVVKDELPALSRLLSVEGLLYLFVGLIAVTSLETWESILQASTDPAGPGELAGRLSYVLSESGSELLDLLSRYPFSGIIWALGFVGVFQLATVMYHNVIPVSAVLIGGSILIWILDRAVANDVDPKLYRSRPRAAVGVIVIFASTWISGVGVAIVTQTTHSTIGSTATAAVAGLLTIAVIGSRTYPALVRARDAIRHWKTRRDVVSGVEHAFDVAESIEGKLIFPTDPTDGPVDAAVMKARLRDFPVRAIAVGLLSNLPALIGGAVVAASAASLPGETWGALVGLLASLAVCVAITRRELRPALETLSAAHDQADEDGVGPTGTTIYIASRKIFGTIGIFALMIVPAYLYHAVATGRIFALVSLAATDSSIQVKTTIAFVLVALVAFVAIQTRPAWGDLAAATKFSLDRQSFRLALKARGLPFLVLFMSFATLLGTGMFSIGTVVVISVLIAVIARGFIWLADRAEHAYAEAVDEEPPKPGRVFVEAVVVEDARGREIAIIWLNGEPIAAPIELVDELVDQAIEDTKSLFENVETQPSAFAYYYERILEGNVDYDNVLVEYRGAISKAIDSEIEKAGRDGIDIDRLDDIMTDEFDPEIYRKKRREKQKKPEGGITIYDGKVRRM